MLFLDLGIAGLLVGTIGGVLLVAAVVKAVRVRKAVRGPCWSAGASPRPGRPAAAGSADGFVAAERMTRYHRPGCSLVAGKTVAAATRPSTPRSAPVRDVRA